MREEFVEGFGFIWRRPFFRVLMVWAALTNLVVNALFFVAILRLIEGGFAPLQIGLVETAAGAFGIARRDRGALDHRAGTDRAADCPGRLELRAAGAADGGVEHPGRGRRGPVLRAASSTRPGTPGIGAYRIAVTPPELIGRVQSATQFASMATMPLAPVIAGVLLSGAGGPAAIAALGLLAAAVALIPTLSRSVRSVPRPAVWQAALSAPAAVVPAA